MAAIVFDLSLGRKTINKTWTFKDLNTKQFTHDAKNRNIKVATDLNAIQNSINNIFLFTPGERVIVPQFGNSLYKYLYEPINEITAQALGRDLVKMINDWEPRIEINNVHIEAVPDYNTFEIEVMYTVPSLGNNVLKFNTAINQRRQ